MNRTTRHGLVLAALASTVMAVPAQAEGDNYLQFSTGADYSSGDYGTTPDTEILAIPVGFKRSLASSFSNSFLSSPNQRLDLSVVSMAVHPCGSRFTAMCG